MGVRQSDYSVERKSVMW